MGCIPWCWVANLHQSEATVLSLKAGSGQGRSLISGSRQCHTHIEGGSTGEKYCTVSLFLFSATFTLPSHWLLTAFCSLLVSLILGSLLWNKNCLQPDAELLPVQLRMWLDFMDTGKRCCRIVSLSFDSFMLSVAKLLLSQLVLASPNALTFDY